MDSLQKAKVSVLINDDNLVPSEVTAILGPPPRLGVAKGDVFVSSNGRHIEARTGMWHYGDGWTTPPHIDQQIADVLSALSRDMSAWQSLTSRYHCYVSIGGYFEGWTGGLRARPKIELSDFSGL